MMDKVLASMSTFYQDNGSNFALLVLINWLNFTGVGNNFCRPTFLLRSFCGSTKKYSTYRIRTSPIHSTGAVSIPPALESIRNLCHSSAGVAMFIF